MSAEIPAPAAATALTRAVLRDADLCVKCGLCLGHCPTYRLTRDEAESPRGRIALMQGLASGLLEQTPQLEGHLDRCLTCRACEAVCPAAVPYGDLIDSTRELLARRNPQRTRLARVMAAVLESRALRYLLALKLIVYQRSGLQWLARRTGILDWLGLARLESLLPKIYWPSLPRAARTSGGQRVALFANCTSPLTEPAALEAAVAVLQALGCDVTVPASQGCCGAIAQHAGLHDDAQACEARNVAAFADAPVVLGIASGCTAQLVEYAAPFAGKARDIHAYIAAHPDLGKLSFDRLDARVALHTPCTQKNVVKGGAAVEKLLETIPGLEIVRLDSTCCGAAGSYFISQPAMADALAAQKVAQVAELKPWVVLSSNVGCAMHLAAALRREGLRVSVSHPLELLAQALGAQARPRGAAAGARPARPA